MTHSRLGLILVYSCVFLSHVACEQNEETVGQKFLDKIKSNIALRREYLKSKGKHFCTTFRVIGKKMEIEEFCDLYQSVCVGSRLNEKVTIITIRNLNVYEPYNVENYTQNIISCIQKHIAGREDALNDIGLTVNYLNASSIPDIDMLNSTLRQIYNAYKLFKEQIFEYFYEICFDVVKNIIAGELNECLYHCGNYHGIIEMNERNDLKDWCDERFSAIVKNIERHVGDGLLYHRLTWYFIDEHTTFSKIFTNLCYREKTFGLGQSAKQREFFHDLFVYLINVKYKCLFRKGIKHLAVRYLPILKKEASHKKIVSCFMDVRMDLIDYLEENETNEYWTLRDAIDGFFKYGTLLPKIHDCFKGIESDKVKSKHKMTYKATNNIIHKKINTEHTTTIIYNGKITNDIFDQLIDVLKEMGLFAKLRKDQFIFMDNRIMMTEAEATKRSNMCDIITFNTSYCEKTVEFTSMITPADEGAEFAQKRKFTYKRDVSKGNETGCMIFNDAFVNLNQTTIIINEFNHEHEATLHQHLKPLLQMCLTNNSSVIVDMHMVTVSNGLQSSFIYISRHIKEETKAEITSLIYDIHRMTFENMLFVSNRKDRYIKCLDNVPGSILDSVSNYLRYLSLTNTRLNIIPSYCLMGNLELIYDENTSKDGELDGSAYYQGGYIDTLYKYRGHIEVTELVSLKQIIEFEKKKTFNCPNIKRLIKRLGLSEIEMYQIILKFVLKKNVNDFTGFETVVLGKYLHSLWVRLYVTFHNDNNRILHLAVSTKSCYIQNILINPITYLTSILNNKQNCTTLKLIEDGMLYTKSNITFVAMVLNDFCKEMKFTVEPSKNFEKRIDKNRCIGILYANIEKVLKRLQDYNNTFNSYEKPTVTYIDPVELQKLIKPKEIGHFAETIVQELKKLAENETLKVTSIKINRQNKQRGNSEKNILAGDISRQYENVECWGRRD